ncbi:hypothetical protein C8T65DRAFT_274375 [Cerioporus squamosus]|nr:hypothetical protein C8T65DRAFT_274375 [Cerioporus squamosus]
MYLRLIISGCLSVCLSPSSPVAYSRTSLHGCCRSRSRSPWDCLYCGFAFVLRHFLRCSHPDTPSPLPFELSERFTNLAR